VNTVKLIPVDLLFDEEGTIAADVVSSSSVLLLPAGVHLQSLRKNHPGALDLLRKHGITKIPIKKAVFSPLKIFATFFAGSSLPYLF